MNIEDSLWPVYEVDGQRCGEELMEDSWEEGFRCTLPPDHHGPHRDTSDWDGDNLSTDSTGRKYRWVMEWRHVNADDV